ncbi:hypothetical protein J6590_052672 [Homalodisca vitripennis]|nr:hypothetical protein J6590_096148 [Homalodisca vitripennis]KAG8301496.1 hypothetical protein J6590_052672 [Homalodisca vitripennis]
MSLFFRTQYKKLFHKNNCYAQPNDMSKVKLILKVDHMFLYHPSYPSQLIVARSNVTLPLSLLNLHTSYVSNVKNTIEILFILLVSQFLLNTGFPGWLTGELITQIKLDRYR